MPSLLIGRSLVDILIVEKLITDYMKDNNIKNMDDIDEKIIQEKYDEIMKDPMWGNP